MLVAESEMRLRLQRFRDARSLVFFIRSGWLVDDSPLPSDAFEKMCINLRVLAAIEQGMEEQRR